MLSPRYPQAICRTYEFLELLDNVTRTAEILNSSSTVFDFRETLDDVRSASDVIAEMNAWLTEIGTA